MCYANNSISGQAFWYKMIERCKTCIERPLQLYVYQGYTNSEFDRKIEREINNLHMVLIDLERNYHGVPQRNPMEGLIKKKYFYFQIFNFILQWLCKMELLLVYE